MNIMNHYFMAKIKFNIMMYKLTVDVVDGAVISLFFLKTPGETFRSSTVACTPSFVCSGVFHCLGLLVSVALVWQTSSSST